MEKKRSFMTIARGKAASIHQQLLPSLRQSGIFLKRFNELDSAQRQSITKYFHQTIFPVLTPLAFDPGRPFPHISNLSLNLAVLIRDKNGVEHFARVKAPDTLPQLIRVPETGKKQATAITFVWIEEVIAANLGKLFPGMEIVAAYPFHVTRDAEIAIKVGHALNSSICPILCVGETLEERESGKTLEVIKRQLDAVITRRLDSPKAGQMRLGAVGCPEQH